jgi:heat shock protein HtpX
MKWPRDFGLKMRMWLTILLLGIVYLIFIGILLALNFPTIVIVPVIFLMVFVQYFFSDRLVLWSTRAKVVSEEEYPELHAMVAELATEAGIPKPRVAIVHTPVPNAFATGRSPSHAVVAVTDSITRLLSKDELKAVIAHELSHVKNRDVLTMTIASFVSMLAFMVMRYAIFFGIGGNRRENAPILVAWIVSIVVWIVSMILINALSRYREYAADRGSAIITRQPHSLITALQKISGRMDYVPPEKRQEVEGANAFFIIPALSGSTLMELFSTHPPLEKRVAALEQIEQEQPWI